jgi:hypothetical protein
MYKYAASVDAGKMLNGKGRNVKLHRFLLGRDVLSVQLFSSIAAATMSTEPA